MKFQRLVPYSFPNNTLKHTAILVRKCVKNYLIPGTDKVIEKGTEIFVPVYGLQMDEKYYVEAEKFKPERFVDDNSAGKLYLPFGDGPRKYIARLDKMQILVWNVLMLLIYKYELESKCVMEFDTSC